MRDLYLHLSLVDDSLRVTLLDPDRLTDPVVEVRGLTWDERELLKRLHHQLPPTVRSLAPEPLEGLQRSTLFGMVFPDRIAEGIRSKKAAGTPVRLRVVTDAERPLEVPVEYAASLLSDAEKPQAVGTVVLDPQVSIARTVAAATREVEPAQLDGPLEVWWLHVDAPPFQSSTEPIAERLGEVIRALNTDGGGLATITRVVSASELAFRLRPGGATPRVHVFIYSGHHDPSNPGLPDGAGGHIDIRHLAKGLHRAGVRLAVLFGCNTVGSHNVGGPAYAIAAEGIPAVIAFQAPGIPIVEAAGVAEAAITDLVRLTLHTAAGRTVDDTARDLRSKINSVHDDLSWAGRLVLFLAEGHDGILFEPAAERREGWQAHVEVDRRHILQVAALGDVRVEGDLHIFGGSA